MYLVVIYNIDNELNFCIMRLHTEKLADKGIITKAEQNQIYKYLVDKYRPVLSAYASGIDFKNECNENLTR